MNSGLHIIGSVAFFLLLLTFSGCSSSNVEAVEKDEKLDLNNVLREYQLQGEGISGTAKAVSKFTAATGVTSYTMEFGELAYPACPGGISAVLYQANNTNIPEIMVPIGTQTGTFSKALPSNFNAVNYPNVRFDCSGQEVGSGESDAVVEVQTRVVKSGEFKTTSDYTVEGKMSIVSTTKMENNVPVVEHILRFEDIEVSSGPDVALYLTPAANPRVIDAPGTLTVQIDGRPRGTFSKSGNFNQVMPTGFNPDLYNGAIVWCRAINEAFGNLNFS